MFGGRREVGAGEFLESIPQGGGETVAAGWTGGRAEEGGGGGGGGDGRRGDRRSGAAGMEMGAAAGVETGSGALRPEAATLERVGGQGHTASAFAVMESGPIDVGTGGPSPTQGQPEVE